jgi:rubrerythrin
MIMNVEEVFEFAAQMERDGKYFYEKAALISFSPEVKTLLSRLAKMEAEHEKLFLEMKEVFIKKLDNSVPDLDGQALAYIRAMADGEIFDAGVLPKDITASTSLREVYHKALDFEKNSIVFFTAIKKFVPGIAEKARIDFLINEELGHVAIILREMAAEAVLKKI